MAERFDEELMLGYVEGDLTPAQRDQFERRLIADPRLRDLLTQMRRDRTALRDLDPQAAPPQLVEHVNHQLERQMLLGDASAPTGRPRSPRFTAGRIVAYSAVAAMLAVCASIVAITLQTTQSLWTMPGDDKYVVAMDMESSNAPADAMADKRDLDMQQRVGKAADARKFAAVEKAEARHETAFAQETVEKGGMPDVMVRDESRFAVQPLKVDGGVAVVDDGKVFPGESPRNLPGGELVPAEPVVEAVETVHMQLDVTTLDPPLCATNLIAYATTNNYEVISPVVEARPVVASQLSKRVDKIIKEAQDQDPDLVSKEIKPARTPRQIVIDMPADELPKLIDELNAIKGQRATIVPSNNVMIFRRSGREPNTDAMVQHAAQRMNEAPDPELPMARQIMAQRGRRPGLRTDWAAVINEQLPLSPVMPVLGPQTRVNLQVVVYKQDILGDNDTIESDGTPAGKTTR